MVVAELRDHGFPYGSVRVVERPGVGANARAAGDRGRYRAEVGVWANQIEGDVSVDEDVIRRELAFYEGDLYQLSRITESQRRIYGLELFQFVNITPRLPEDRVAASAGRRDRGGRQTSASPARRRATDRKRRRARASTGVM